MLLNDIVIITLVTIFISYTMYIWKEEEKNSQKNFSDVFNHVIFGGIIGLVIFVLLSLPLFLTLLFFSYSFPSSLRVNDIYELFGVTILTSAGSALGEFSIERLIKNKLSTNKKSIVINTINISIKTIERIFLFYIISHYILGSPWKIWLIAIISLIDAIIDVVLEWVEKSYSKQRIN
ncbi:MAG: hypothetical protein RBR24_05230 [Candidatus Carbobacillus sp.]|nr:hypothetical protein [Candidatus Carbobacillus sp.]